MYGKLIDSLWSLFNVFFFFLSGHCQSVQKGTPVHQTKGHSAVYNPIVPLTIFNSQPDKSEKKSDKSEKSNHTLPAHIKVQWDVSTNITAMLCKLIYYQFHNY